MLPRLVITLHGVWAAPTPWEQDRLRSDFICIPGPLLRLHLLHLPPFKSLSLTPALQQKTCLSSIHWTFPHFCPSTPVPPVRRASNTNKTAGPWDAQARGFSRNMAYPFAICFLRCLLEMIRGPQCPMSGRKVTIQKARVCCLASVKQGHLGSCK